MRMSWRQLAGLMGCLLTMHPGANATESGAIRAVNGAAASEIASPQFPGWYGQFWVQHYRADKLRDEQGRSPALRSEDSIVGPLEVQRQAAAALARHKPPVRAGRLRRSSSCA